MCAKSNPKQDVAKDLKVIKLKKGETVNMSKALGSSKRLAILQHLSKEELNLSEIAEKLKKDGMKGSTPQAVYHHLQILESSKLIRVVREKKIKNMDKTIKFYRSNYQPDAINVILWGPLEDLEPAELESRIPIQIKPVGRIVKKMANKVFHDLTDMKIEILTKFVKEMVDITYDSMNSLREDYDLEINEKLWSLILLFSNLSTMNAIKKMVEDPEHKKTVDDLLSLLFEEMSEYNNSDRE